ncbi:protein TIC 40, chloroplastic-like [Typha angustifolia]|uniref:protein TIC 40, chloroplastic-like n=1 Tax=Typha angustifolia TaxID=59011 RepID=UPI003C2D56B5
MENLALASSRLPILVGVPGSSVVASRRRSEFPASGGGQIRSHRRTKFFVSAVRLGGSDGGAKRSSKDVPERLKIQGFASMSTSSSNELTTASGTAVPVPPSSPYIGSPLFWIGVGVALSALFSVVSTKLKRYAMQQAFKTMMDQAAPQQGQYNNPAFSVGSPFPFPAAPQTAPNNFSTSKATQDTSQKFVTVDVPPTKVEAAPTSEIRDEAETRKESKKFAFVDISPEELLQKDREYSTKAEDSVTVDFEEKVSTNGSAFHPNDNASTEQAQTGKSTPSLSVDALEKMLEDPTVQKMLFPYLPAEMRSPENLKGLLQTPQFRMELQDMLNKMGGNTNWDNNMMDTLKNFDLNSPEVKQQFEQIGLTPEEVISKIMSKPEVATAFQNPRVQAAILDCSQNPLNIAKYQHDKEVMDVFTKISELFPGATGYP